MTCRALVAGAYSDDYWVAGVNQDGGWFDTNKVVNSSNYSLPQDDLMCWAGVAANILQYMQHVRGNEIVYTESYSTNQNCNQYAIYETFTSNFENALGNTYNGISWYTTGSYSTAYLPSFKSDAPNPAGAFSSPAHTYTADNIIAYQYGFSSSGNIDYTAIFSQALSYGPIALDIKRTSATSGHGLTCWGFRTDENGMIDAIYVTDTDDTFRYKYDESGQLVRDENGSIINFMNTTDQNTLVTLDVSERTDGLYLDSYTNLTDYEITNLTTFNNLYIMVPEPTTASLSLLGLASLLLRRRR